MKIKVDIRVPVGKPLPELADFVRSCEDAGFHGVGVHDHHHTGRDAYMALAVAALKTTDLELYPATTNSVTRHPLVLAALAHSLSEIAPGRVLLSLAPGFLSVEQAGQRRASRDQLREVVTAVRTLLAGSSTQLGERNVRLRNTSAPPPKVLVLASGPRLLELAGEVADGAMMLVGLDPASVGEARRHLHKGAARAGRDVRELQEIFIVPTAIGDRAWATQWPRRYFRPGQPWLAYPSASNLRWLAAAGVPLPDDPRPEEISPRVAEQICDVLGLFGPPEHCAERLLRAREEVGLDHVFLFPVHTAESGYDLPATEVEAFRDVVGPRLR